MRFAILLVGTLALFGCNKPSDERDREYSTPPAATFDSSAENVEPSAARMAAPGITPTAAPGVAFNYRYAFRLPGARIAAVQEQHAQACEKLGINRCRITGMRYRLLNEHDVSAMLAFKLDPAIARQFGKQGIEAVNKAEGMLVDSEISGVDAASGIAAAERSVKDLKASLAVVEAQLAKSGLDESARMQLLDQASRLRQSISATQSSSEEQKESLANTPMTYQYGSGGIVPGFDVQSPLKSALEQAGGNLLAGVSVLIVLVASLLPWVLLILLGIFLVRRSGPLLKRVLGLKGSKSEAAIPEE